MDPVRIRTRRSSARALRLVVALALAALVTPGPVVPAMAGPGAADTYWVDIVNGADTNPGTEAAPFKTLTHALFVADQLDTIMILPGTYDTANGETFPLVGQGECLKGVEGADLTQIAGDGTSKVMDWRPTDAGDYVEGLTFTGGGVDMGAGLYVFTNTALTAPDTPRITACIFADNDAMSNAGALFLGGVDSGPVHPLVERCLFYDNEATGGGGAVFIGGYASVTVTDTTFSANRSAGAGGAIYVDANAGPLVCEDSVFSGCEGSTGGAVLLGSGLGLDAVHEFERNLFFGNTALNDGGALAVMDGDHLQLSGNTAQDNSSSTRGGFAFLSDAEVTSENNVIVSSSSPDGCAWNIGNGLLEVNNDTVVHSTGGLYAVAGSMDGLAEIRNTVFWNPDVDFDLSVSGAVLDHCNRTNTGGTGSGTGNIVGDPMLVDAPNGDVRLRVGSPCIDTADPATAAATDRNGESRPIDGDGNGSALPDMGAFERPEIVVGALQGDNRYETAAVVALSAFESADTAIIASGENFPDALSAAGLAGSYEAPLLLVQHNAVPPVVAGALGTLGVSDVIIVGGEAAVSADVASALGASYGVDRIQGADRYETAAAVARRIAERVSLFWPAVFIARGDAFPDALAASPLAYSMRRPILLVRPDALPPATADAIEDLDIMMAWVVGGESAVSADVKDLIDAKLVANSGGASTRWAGANRYETARAVAEKGVADTMASWSYVGIATGENFPDALAGGVAAGAHYGVIGLTASTTLPASTHAMLEANAVKVMECDVFGGPSAVAPAVRAAIADALGW